MPRPADVRMPRPLTPTAHPWSPLKIRVLLGLGLLLTAIVYWPSVHGTFAFDDYPNIVSNPAVHLESLDASALRRAALSSPSKELMRPLAMLSFALNWYVSGANPYWMKVVNLVIHLLNGLLLFGLLRSIALSARSRQEQSPSTGADINLLALFISVAWLLAPINFTAVGYIVQRMESLCQIFVLGGLWGYVAARRHMLRSDSGIIYTALAIVAGTSLGGLAKESAALLPLYALILEWGLFHFLRRDGKVDKLVCAFYVIVLALPALVAAGWLLTRYLPVAAWAYRPFTLSERLLTEPRILVDYARWTLLPTANSLALYHDNIAVSRGILSPPTTLASILFLLCAAVAAFFLRNRRPLAAVGILWFLSAHLLTGTVVPLELVFEHRNYFASIGVYLVVFPFIVPAPNESYRLARATACAAILILFATVTWIRALDWGNPASFAISEAQKNPKSARTAYELGRTYVILSRYDPDSSLIPMAYTALEHAAAMRGADALPDQALLLLSANLHRPAPASVWTRMQHKLATQPLSVENIDSLYSLSQCAIAGRCDFPAEEVVRCFTSALRHQPPNTSVLSIYANYAIDVLRDPALAIELARSSVAEEPRNLQLKINLLGLLESNGQRAEAVAFYQQSLRELSGAADDPVYRAWGELLHAPPSTNPSHPIPQDGARR